MIQSFSNKIGAETGTTLVESIVAITLISVIMLGGFQFFVGGKSSINDSGFRRLAIIRAEERLEAANRFEYAVLADSLDETQTVVNLGSLTGLRTTVVTATDDPIDGLAGADLDGDPDDYKQITTTISWPLGGQNQVSLSTSVSADYRQ
ncbi:MAG: hypothetical protein V1681_08020 [Candidatus Neomarinimicrobiota bacterium]